MVSSVSRQFFLLLENPSEELKTGWCFHKFAYLTYPKDFQVGLKTTNWTRCGTDTFFFGSFKLDLSLFDPVPGHSAFSDIGGVQTMGFSSYLCCDTIRAKNPQHRLPGLDSANRGECWGYIPPNKFVKPEEEDPSKPLNAEDEVALLLKEDLMKQKLRQTQLDWRKLPSLKLT